MATCQARNMERWRAGVGGFLAYSSTMMSSEAVPIGHHDEQGVTLGKSSASTAHASVTMRFTSSGARYSRLRLASFG